MNHQFLAYESLQSYFNLFASNFMKQIQLSEYTTNENLMKKISKHKKSFI